MCLLQCIVLEELVGVARQASPLHLSTRCVVSKIAGKPIEQKDTLNTVLPIAI